MAIFSQRAKRLPIGVLYFGIIALPPGVFYFGLSSSQTLGFMLLAVAMLSGRFVAIAQRQKLALASKVRLVKWSAVVLLFIAMHFAIAALFRPVDIFRAATSAVPLVLLFLAGASLADDFLRVPNRVLHQGMVRCFVVMCCLALLATLGLAIPSSEDWRRPVFPFSEPSMFALAFIPLLMYVGVSSRGLARVGYLLLGLVCTTLIQNLTLAAGFFLVAMVTIRWPALLVFVAVLVVGGARLDLSYYADRLNFSDEGMNLSNLVYVQGWQMIVESLQRSGGFGLGFQQLGVQGTDVDAALLLRSLLAGEDMNLLDGGFVFAKLASDFGVFGCLLGIAFLYQVYRSFLMLRDVSNGCNRLTPVIILAHCFVVSYSIELFVRGAGYFTGASMLFVVAQNVFLWQRRRHTVSGMTFPHSEPITLS